MKWAVLIACSYGNPPVPEVLTNLEYMEKLIGLLCFDRVSVFKEEKATRKTVDEFFEQLDAACEEHRKTNSDEKFLFVCFYSGHGWNV